MKNGGSFQFAMLVRLPGRVGGMSKNQGGHPPIRTNGFQQGFLPGNCAFEIGKTDDSNLWIPSDSYVQTQLVEFRSNWGYYRQADVQRNR